MLRELERAAWMARRARHRERVDRATADHLARAERGLAHPIHDFLFTYYRTRPGELRRWHPGLDVELAAHPSELDDATHYRATAPGRVALDPRGAFAHRLDGIEWIGRLLRASAARPAHLGCFGLHEWAMVYQRNQSQVRHQGLALRLAQDQIAAVVAERPLRCTHFDAYRFFTPAARPLNTVELSRANQIDHDQPGCLHVAMDLYKWAGKLSPAVDSELIMDCFELARDVRVVDMRASPYDVTELGFEPIEIELPSGRQSYISYQRDFAVRAQPLRARLIDIVDELERVLRGA